MVQASDLTGTTLGQYKLRAIINAGSMVDTYC